MAGDELVEGIDERVRTNGSKKPSQRPGESQLYQQRDAASCVSWQGCPVPGNQPPALVSAWLGNPGKQPNRLVVGEREQGELAPTIESRDGTRRETTEASGARVEQHRAREAAHLPGPSTAATRCRSSRRG
jgi:hypothetical protein